ncbi:protein MFI isoform X2 [Channa argus]|uniref:protein MFI isoform X2 n=1 Tax=Channa argus TaxID=215402 RepID=UPI00351F97E3
MSSQDEGPQEPQQEMVQQIASRIIQKAWRRYVCREVFKYFKELITQCNQQDPQSILKTVNPREISFPPNIYYKIFTHRPIADVCASSPKDYTQPGFRKPGDQQTNNSCPLMKDDQSGCYQRMENNSWRFFCNKVGPVGEPMEIGANKKMDFHYSKLQRQQDVVRWRKRRKIEWLKQMYSWGRLQTHPVHRHTVTQMGNSAQEVMNTTEKRGNDEMLEWEVDELLSWTNALSFEEYIDEWRHLACAHSSQCNKGENQILKKDLFPLLFLFQV